MRHVGKVIGKIVWFPVGCVLEFRRSLTAASATLLFFLVLTLNIVWGYPWIGMFSVCFSILLVGWVANRIFAPRGIRVSVRLPSSVMAGESWMVRQHLENAGRMPAMELRVRLAGPSARRAGLHLGPADWVNLISPRERVEIPATLCIDRRGVWQVPDVVVESFFPFQLFRAMRRIKIGATIAITPRLLHASEEPAIRAGLTAVSGLASQQAAGSSAEYVGSREYQTGMTVRHWDFVSWARLGRPIVREFTTPGLQTIVIVVDTGIERLRGSLRSGKARRRLEAEQRFEHLLSVAATVLVERGRGDLRFRLFVTGEEDRRSASDLTPEAATVPGDIEPLLVRLAAAEPLDPAVADAQISRFLAGSTEPEVLVLSAREAPGFMSAGTRRITMIRLGHSEVAELRVSTTYPGHGDTTVSTQSSSEVVR